MDSQNEEINRRPASAAAERGLGVVVAASSFAAYAWVFSKVYAFMTTPMPASLNLADVFLP